MIIRCRTHSLCVMAGLLFVLLWLAATGCRATEPAPAPAATVVPFPTFTATPILAPTATPAVIQRQSADSTTIPGIVQPIRMRYPDTSEDGYEILSLGPTATIIDEDEFLLGLRYGNYGYAILDKREPTTTQQAHLIIPLQGESISRRSGSYLLYTDLLQGDIEIWDVSDPTQMHMIKTFSVSGIDSHNHFSQIYYWAGTVYGLIVNSSNSPVTLFAFRDGQLDYWLLCKIDCQVILQKDRAIVRRVLCNNDCMPEIALIDISTPNNIRTLSTLTHEILPSSPSLIWLAHDQSSILIYGRNDGNEQSQTQEEEFYMRLVIDDKDHLRIEKLPVGYEPPAPLQQPAASSIVNVEWSDAEVVTQLFQEEKPAICIFELQPSVQYGTILYQLGDDEQLEVRGPDHLYARMAVPGRKPVALALTYPLLYIILEDGYQLLNIAEPTSPTVRFTTQPYTETFPDAPCAFLLDGHLFVLDEFNLYELAAHDAVRIATIPSARLGGGVGSQGAKFLGSCVHITWGGTYWLRITALQGRFPHLPEPCR